MNKIKILILAIVVGGVVAIGIAIAVSQLGKSKEIALPKNQFTSKIEDEIKQLQVKPDNKFCKGFYDEVISHINEFYKPLPPTYPYGRFGKTQSENDQWKGDLEKMLYSAYAEKFIAQAKSVFHGSVWNPADLRFIQAEKNKLKKSRLLVAGSPVDNEFTTIQTALNKYNEIVGFISNCRGFNYSGTDLSDRFPITDVQSKISHEASLLSHNLGNEYVKNCSRLQNELREIPHYLFRSHIRYLENKISYWSDMYSNYNSQSDYSNNLYRPLRSEIEALDNDIYNVGNFDIEYNRLLQKWSTDNSKAYNYKY